MNLQPLIAAIHSEILRAGSFKTTYPKLKPFFHCDVCGEDKPRLGNRRVTDKDCREIIGWACSDCQRLYSTREFRQKILG